MLFPGMSEYQFATFFVVSKQEQIAQDLQIKNLCIYTAIKTVTKFILRTRYSIQSKYENQYDSLDDEIFYTDVLNVLKKAKKRGVPLEYKL